MTLFVLLAACQEQESLSRGQKKNRRRAAAAADAEAPKGKKEKKTNGIDNVTLNAFLRRVRVVGGIAVSGQELMMMIFESGNELNDQVL